MFTPVKYEEKTGGFRTVADPRAAARVLVDRWKWRRGPAYYRAAEACTAAIDGGGSEEAASAAFRAALDEAGVFVRG